MNRKKFIQYSSLGLGATFLLKEVWLDYQSEIPTEELLGKGSPIFYGKDYKIRQEANEAFLKMKKAALEEADINIQIVSSYRSFAHQKRIWTRKYNTFTQQGLTETEAITKIIEYSTIPGTSRHHWGTDIDIIDGNAPTPKNVLLPENFNKNGPYCKLKEWMDQNASAYNFQLVYTNKEGRKGFFYEPWHFSYAPLSVPYLKKYRKLPVQELLKEEKLLGSEHFTEDFVQKYISNHILDINPVLLS